MFSIFLLLGAQSIIAQPEVTVTYPSAAGIESYTMETITITWTTNLTSNIKIELVTDDGAGGYTVVETIANEISPGPVK